MESTQLSLNIALLPPPGFLGHLIPFVELARKLVSNHNCTVTLIIPDDGTTMKFQRSLLEGIPATITPIFLPPVSTADLPEGVRPEVMLPIRVARSLPALRDVLSRTQAAALVVDLFAPDAIDVARELGIPAFVFYVIAANDLSLSTDLPEPGDMPELIKLPGDVVVNPEDFPDSMKDTNGEIYKFMFDLSNKWFSADGVLVNSFQQLESAAFEHLGFHPGVPPVYPVGPLIRTTEQKPESNLEPECLKWLDDQPSNSVMFVSFGSGGALSVEQIGELASGLETSGQRFLWVVRTPQETFAAAYLKAGDHEEKNPLEYLPEGFLERTRGRGLAVASWAPQIRVLSHGSTGGFLTHCGWNSILESVVHGVPLIAWPLCFEQKMTAVFVADGLKGAIRVRENENGIVEREKVSNAVKELMQGEEGRRIRNTMIQLKIAAEEALSGDGSSTNALAQVVQILKNGKLKFNSTFTL